MHSHHRLPISSRHAFALAFDLAVRRDLVHSIIVPLLLQTPWFILVGGLPSLEESRTHLVRVTLLSVFALLGQSFTGLLVMSMLRFRARSVFNTPVETHPAPVMECYAKAIRRVPALYATELLRYLALLIGGLFLYFPGLYLSFKLSMVTETIVLNPGGITGAFKRSFHLTEGRWERWLEMIALSVMLVLSILFVLVIGFFSVPNSSWSSWVAVGMLLTAAVLPVVQYAWTFFYLRLEESESAAAVSRTVMTPSAAAGATAASRQTGTGHKLRLVELARDDDEGEGPASR
jgi:hypothetical protein